jgi:hypothetical protein
VAAGANFHGDLFPDGFGVNFIPAGTSDHRIHKLGMNPFLHFNPPDGTGKASILFAKVPSIFKFLT